MGVERQTRFKKGLNLDQVPFEETIGIHGLTLSECLEQKDGPFSIGPFAKNSAERGVVEFPRRQDSGLGFANDVDGHVRAGVSHGDERSERVEG